MTQDLIDRIKAKANHSPAAKYLVDYTHLSGSHNYLWDELAAAAWLDPTLITKKENRYMDVDLNAGAGYGDTLTWSKQDKPKHNAHLVEVQIDLDTDKFYKMFVELMGAPPVTREGKNRLESIS